MFILLQFYVKIHLKYIKLVQTHVKINQFKKFVQLASQNKIKKKTKNI